MRPNQGSTVCEKHKFQKQLDMFFSYSLYDDLVQNINIFQSVNKAINVLSREEFSNYEQLAQGSLTLESTLFETLPTNLTNSLLDMEGRNEVVNLIKVVNLLIIY